MTVFAELGFGHPGEHERAAEPRKMRTVSPSPLPKGGGRLFTGGGGRPKLSETSPVRGVGPANRLSETSFVAGRFSGAGGNFLCKGRWATDLATNLVCKGSGSTGPPLRNVVWPRPVSPALVETSSVRGGGRSPIGLAQTSSVRGVDPPVHLSETWFGHDRSLRRWWKLHL